MGEMEAKRMSDHTVDEIAAQIVRDDLDPTPTLIVPLTLLTATNRVTIHPTGRIEVEPRGE